MITVKIEEETAVEMLMERVEYWTDDTLMQELYRKMYENYVYGGCFDDGDFDVMSIVDNDYINWCKIVCDGDNDWEELLNIYNEQGLGDCSCETKVADFIEAVDDSENPQAFLIRV